MSLSSHVEEIEAVHSITQRLIAGGTWRASIYKNPILKNHCRILARQFSRQNPIAESLREPCLRLIPIVEKRSDLLTEVGHSRLPIIPILTRLAGYSELWIRDPETWCPNEVIDDPRRLLLSLIAHLLARYEVPEIFEQAWFVDGKLKCVERDWYCHVAQGGSLRSAPGIPVLTKRGAAIVPQLSSEDYSLKEAIRHAQVQSIDTRLSFADVDQMPVGIDFAHDWIWLPLLQAFAGGQRSVSELHLICDWIALQRGSGVAFSCKPSRPWEELVSSARKAYLSLVASMVKQEGQRKAIDIMSPQTRKEIASVSHSRWESALGLPEYQCAYKGWKWRIVELTTLRDLAAEGADMNHCVGSYFSECKLGETSIYSLWSCKEGESVMDRDLTIEVWPESSEIWQIKAWNNRSAHANSLAVVKKWAEVNNLEISKWADL